MTDKRPDPITPKTLGWTTALAILGAIVSAAIDTGWKLPETNNTMDWVRSILILLFAAAGVYVGASKAKRETTPLIDPRDEHGRKLVPAGSTGRGDVASSYQDDPPPPPPLDIEY
jgi:hypothetical protein